MLTAEESAFLTRVGAGTPIGDLMRRYWIPVVPSAELEAGGRVRRVKLLGEDLVAFRAPSGRPGLMGEFCPHRRASLYFGRNEELGLRCVYHGWQFELGGHCIDMPNERPEFDFQDKVRHTSYPCAERGGVVWTYMGPAPAPGLPDLEWALVPDEPALRVALLAGLQLPPGPGRRRRPRAHQLPARHPRRAGRRIARGPRAGGRGLRLHRGARARAAPRGRGHRRRSPHRRPSRRARGPVLLAHHPVPGAVPHHAARRGRRGPDAAHARVGPDGRPPARQLVRLLESAPCHHRRPRSSRSAPARAST